MNWSERFAVGPKEVSKQSLVFFLGGGAWWKRRKGTKKQKSLMFVYMTMMAYLRYTTRLYFLVLQCICLSHIPSCAFSMFLNMLSLDLLDIYIYICTLSIFTVIWWKSSASAQSATCQPSVTGPGPPPSTVWSPSCHKSRPWKFARLRRCLNQQCVTVEKWWKKVLHRAENWQGFQPKIPIVFQ